MSHKYDWEAIERDWRTGRHTLAQLSGVHGPSASQISRRATKEGWQKDLSEDIKQRTRERIARPDTAPAEATDDEVVEQASEENEAIIRRQRTSLDRWRGIADRFADRLDGELDQESVSLEYLGKALSAGTQAMERVVKLERQSYGLDTADADDQGRTFAELMAEVAPDDPE